MPAIPWPLSFTAATIPDTWLPWPFWSSGVLSPFTKSQPAGLVDSCGASSGEVEVTPVSAIPTVSPAPVLSGHASSASMPPVASVGAESDHCDDSSGSAAKACTGAFGSAQTTRGSAFSSVSASTSWPSGTRRTSVSGSRVMFTSRPPASARMSERSDAGGPHL